MNKAAGKFEVKINPLAPYNTAADANLGRLSIDKEFRGDLEATSQREMLSAGIGVGGAQWHDAYRHRQGKAFVRI
jgi:hypothetical protein